jgi:hypothetical protein
MPQIPPRLRKSDRDNFETIRRAYAREDLALVSAIRKSDGANVALVCAMQTNDDDTITPVPLAVMIEGDPFSLFDDPTVQS